jgi:hypothetical protein
MCDHYWLETSYTKVCNRCGLETPFLTLSEWDAHSAPLSRNYDRQRRFQNKVDRLLGMHQGPQCGDPIWKYLETCPNLRCPSDIRNAIRRSSLTSKHYDCIRVFTDVFTTFRVQPKHDVHRLKKYLCDQFNTVHQLWAFSGQQGFFSYDFLLRKYVESTDSPLVVYLKPRTNKRRHTMYTKKLARLSQRENKRCYHNSVKSHSRCVSALALNPPSLRQLAWGRGGLAEDDPRIRNVGLLVNHVLGRLNTTGK